MIENGIHVGISMISRRYAKANISNTADYNNKGKGPPNCIIYRDENNL